MNEPLHELEAYFAGEYTEEQFRAIEAWLHADPANAKAFMAKVHFRELVGQCVREQRNETGAVLAELAQLEAAAEAETVTLVGELPEHAEPGGLSGHDLAVVGKYVLHKALGSKHAIHAGLGLAAALALLVTVLILNWGEPGDSEPIVSNDSTADSPTEKTDRTPLVPVATLTAAQGARWEADFDFGTPELGKGLYVGQRLTLQEGFAEITTGRAATLILEAPCSVEMIDSPNAIRLISGKLVGHVDRDTAKGLLIRTPHMDITDLGTRFGVACREDGTYLRVFEGEVFAVPVKASATVEQTVVAAGQSVVVPFDEPRVARVDLAVDRFVTSIKAVTESPALTGDIRYEPSIPSDLRTGAYESSEIRLFKERTGVVLSEPIAVNIIGPGRFENVALQQPVTLKPTKTDSYLIHLDTLPNDGSGRMHRATIRFQRPIVGVITSSQAMADAHAAVGMPDVLYGTMSDGDAGRFTGFDNATEQHAETVEISADRRTLTLQISTGNGIDQARVLVASDVSP
jgi:hypothetical protein